MSTYTVVPGDFLFKIAQDHGISLDALIAANPQLNGSTNLEIGQVLNLPGGSPGNSGPGSSGNSDIDQTLAIHNQARQEANQHGQTRGDLTWDDNLASAAAEWANHLASTGTFEHSGFPDQGENLYFEKGLDPSFAAASQAWIDEQVNYHGELIGQGNFGSYGHYTQCIWPSTTSVGIATATGSDGTTYAVGRYQPPGNFTGQSAW